MERYFLGNNTAYGFEGYYEETLRSSCSESKIGR